MIDCKLGLELAPGKVVTMNPILKPKEALKAVRLDYFIFANAVASKELTFLPPAARGSPRKFDITALVPLWIFARLTEPRGDNARERLSSKEAGKVANRIGLAVAEHPNANHIVVLTDMNELIDVFPLDEIGSLSTVTAQIISDSTKLRDVRVWSVQNIREHLQHAIGPASTTTDDGRRD